MQPLQTGNLLEGIPDEMPDEIFGPLCGGPSAMGRVRVDRIVSRGQISPEGSWYDQDEDEFVLLVQGEARLTVVEGGRDRHITMKAMDWIYLPAHMRHRVDWTDPEQDSVWLAVYY